MVKSRRASKNSPACYSPPHVLTQDEREGAAVSSMVTQASSANTERPPSRSPGHRTVRDELGKVTRLGSVLNYSDDQSSNNEEFDDDVDPASPASEVQTVSHPSSSPDPCLVSASATHLDNSSPAGSVADFKSKLANSPSAAEAALAFQRWRISSLKVLFTQDLHKAMMEAQEHEARMLVLEEDLEKKEKHLVHALADCAQLRAQLCALQNVNGRQHESSDIEALQMELAKALERATSSEADMERYNKEIRKLRERLKSTEDEANRLDSELKATVSFWQKEKEGVAKENQVLLQQLARKDEEVLCQLQEINNLKNVLACLRVSRLELDRLKSELQGGSPQRMKIATSEKMADKSLESQTELEYRSSEAVVDLEEQLVPSGPVLSQLLDVLQKLTACLHKNQAQLEPSGVKVPAGEEKLAVRSDLPQKGAMHLEAAADCKPINSAGQVASFVRLKHQSTKGPQSCYTANDDLRGNKLFAVTCWKWRWVAAASEVQELSKIINSLNLVSRQKTGSFQLSSFISCLDNLQASLSKECPQDTQHPKVDLQAPLSFDKVFALLTSIWKLCSQNALQEKEAFQKGRQFDHLLRMMTRWMQRASEKRQLKRVIAHWLRYLLQSWKDKFKHQNVALALASHLKQGRCHGLPLNSVVQNQNSTCNLKSRTANTSLIKINKGSQKPGKDASNCTGQALETLQESLHHRLEALEASIMKEASYWHQQNLGDANHACESFGESASRNLVSKMYCELERCFFEARNQIMTYFGVLNKVPSHNRMEQKIKGSAFSSNPVVGQVKVKFGTSKKPVERWSSAQAIARKRKNIFI